MDISSPRPSQRPSAAMTQPRELNPTCEDYYSDDSEVEYRPHRDVPRDSNVIAERFHRSDLGATKTDKFNGVMVTAAMSSADSASAFSDAKSTSASSNYSKDSGYYSGLDAIHLGIVSRPDSPAVKRGPTLSFQFNAKGELFPAEDSMADVDVGHTSRSRSENMNSSSPRKPLQKRGSPSSKRPGECGNVNLKECSNPNCTVCKPNALSRRPQQTAGYNRGSTVVELARTPRRISPPPLEHKVRRLASYHSRPLRNDRVSGMPSNPQYALPQLYPTPPQDLGPLLSASTQNNRYPTHFTHYYDSDVWPSRYITPIPSPAYDMREAMEWEKDLQTAERKRRRLVENPQRQIPLSGVTSLPTASTPLRTDPIMEAQLPLTRSQKPSTAPLAPQSKVDTISQEMLGANRRSGSPKRAIVSVEPQKLLPSSEKMREDMGKTSELRKHLQSGSVSPILPPKTDSILADDLPLEVQHVQADRYEHDVATRPKSITLLIRPPITGSMPTQRDDPAPGLEHDKGDLGTIERSDKFAHISHPEPMEQLESPSFPPNTSTGITTCATADKTHGVQDVAIPAKELVLFLDPGTIIVPQISRAVNYTPSSDIPISRLERFGGSSVSDAEEEEHSFIETDKESDEASEECEVSVKSALDTAMNVVKGLLLRELLDYALPEATDVLEGSGSSNSGSHAGSASSSASSSLSSRTSNSQTPQRRKRTRGNGRNLGDGDGGDDSDDDDRPKKKNEKGSPDRLPCRRLKCPFYQRQPEKYKKAACRGEGFADMAKLKDHIKRVHTQPLRCSRCWLEMKSDDAFSEHQQQEKSCEKKAEPQDDRIRPQLLKRLDFKKAPYATARNVEEKWNILFTVLFPNDTSIPSPCKSTLLAAMS
jgi:hypothetical protein